MWHMVLVAGCFHGLNPVPSQSGHMWEDTGRDMDFTVTSPGGRQP